MTARSDPDMASVWTYDIGANGIGNLDNETITAGRNGNWTRVFQYDSLGRAAEISTAFGGTWYDFTATYDAASRLRTVTYPSGLVLSYTYTSLGYAQQIAGPGGQVYWTGNARAAELHLTPADRR
jgi:YD repeat-containing protein